MKLHPERMLSSRAGLAQPQITIVSNLSDGKPRTIQATRNHTSRTATALPQNKIAEHIAFPPRHRLHDRIGGDVLPTRRRIECDPTAKSVRAMNAILSDNVERKYQQQCSRPQQRFDRICRVHGIDKIYALKYLRYEKFDGILRASRPRTLVPYSS
jgi:hypothetical protein